ARRRRGRSSSRASSRGSRCRSGTAGVDAQMAGRTCLDNVPRERSWRHRGTFAMWGVVNVPRSPAKASSGALNTSPPEAGAIEVRGERPPELLDVDVQRAAIENLNYFS